LSLGQDAYTEIIPRALAFEQSRLAGLGPRRMRCWTRWRG
jgi:hypothetical protein